MSFRFSPKRKSAWQKQERRLLRQLHNHLSNVDDTREDAKSNVDGDLPVNLQQCLEGETEFSSMWPNHADSLAAMLEKMTISTVGSPVKAARLEVLVSKLHNHLHIDVVRRFWRFLELVERGPSLTDQSAQKSWNESKEHDEIDWESVLLKDARPNTQLELEQHHALLLKHSQTHVTIATTETSPLTLVQPLSHALMSPPAAKVADILPAKENDDMVAHCICALFLLPSPSFAFDTAVGAFLPSDGPTTDLLALASTRHRLRDWCVNAGIYEDVLPLVDRTMWEGLLAGLHAVHLQQDEELMAVEAEAAATKKSVRWLQQRVEHLQSPLLVLERMVHALDELATRDHTRVATVVAGAWQQAMMLRSQATSEILFGLVLCCLEPYLVIIEAMLWNFTTPSGTSLTTFPSWFSPQIVASLKSGLHSSTLLRNINKRDKHSRPPEGLFAAMCERSYRALRSSPSHNEDEKQAVVPQFVKTHEEDTSDLGKVLDLCYLEQVSYPDTQETHSSWATRLSPLLGNMTAKTWLDVALLPILEARKLELALTLRHVLVQEGNLWQTFSAFRHLYLLQDSTLTSFICDKLLLLRKQDAHWLAPELSERDRAEKGEIVVELLEEGLRWVSEHGSHEQSELSYVQKIFSGCLTVIYNGDESSELLTDFRVIFVPTNSLTALVLPRVILTAYEKILRFLLPVQLALAALRQVAKVRRQVHQPVAFALVYRCINFLSGVADYSRQRLDLGWIALSEELQEDSKAEVRLVMKAHARFVQAALTELMLEDRFAHVLKKLHQLTSQAVHIASVAEKNMSHKMVDKSSQDWLKTSKDRWDQSVLAFVHDLSNLVAQGFSPHLELLITMVNYNGFYTEKY